LENHFTFAEITPGILQSRRTSRQFSIIYRYAMKELQQHYDAYHNLRQFLGYNIPTKCETAVYEILKAEENNPFYQKIFSE
jgi:hypothetical protein